MNIKNPPPDKKFQITHWVIFLTLLASILPSTLPWDTINLNEQITGSWVVQLQWGPLFLISLLLILDKYFISLIIEHTKKNIFIPLLIAFCASTVLWSPFPITTIKRSIQLIGICFIGIAVARNLPKNHTTIVTATLNSTFLIVIASVMFAIFLPQYGKESSLAFELKGAWKGVLPQKNSLGQVACVGMYCWVFLYVHQKILTPYIMAQGLITAICLFMSRSSTSIVLATLLCCVVFISNQRKIKFNGTTTIKLMISIIIITLITTLLHYIYHSQPPTLEALTTPFANMFGKGSDLSGRSNIWNFVLSQIPKHLWQGYGYAAFWPIPPSNYAQFFYEKYNQSHNGYLDILNEIGVIGASLTVLMLVQQTVNFFKIRRTHPLLFSYSISMLLYCLISNITETTFLRGNNLMQVTFFITAMMCNQLLIDQRNPITPHTA
jgi:O-antigen ligase